MPDASFVVNPDKPRKVCVHAAARLGRRPPSAPPTPRHPPTPNPLTQGCFEVRRGGQVFVSLTGLPRPFKALRELEMAGVAAQVAAALQPPPPQQQP